MREESIMPRTAPGQTRTETTTCTCTADLTLPDYLPDIRRVLSVRVRVMPGGTFVDRGKAEFAGSCRFFVLYLDPEGRPASASLSGDYEWSVPTGAPDGAEARAAGWCEAGAVACRPGGPRRLSCTAELVCRAMIFSPGEPGEEETETTQRHEKLKKQVTGRVAEPFFCEPIHLSENVRLNRPGEIRVLSADGGIRVEEPETAAGECRARGEVMLNVLCADEDGDVFGVPVKMPFEGRLFDVREGATVRTVVRGDLTSCEADVSEEEGGSSLTVSASVLLSGVGYEETTEEVTTDRFSTEYPSRVDYGTTEVWETPMTVTAAVTMSGSEPREADENEGPCRVADTYVTAGPVSLSVEGNRLSAGVELRVGMLLRGAPDADGRTELSYFSFDSPQTIEVTLPSIAPEGATATGTLSILSAKGRCEGERVSFECEAALSAEIDVLHTMRIARSATDDTEHPYPQDEDCLTAAYLCDGDSLWSVAKRYHTSPERIAGTNALSGDALRAPDSAYPLDGYIKLLIEQGKKD
ncbi:MAG: LysM peptidoglycan-binding domain-containing protein [Clostridia bacterium]|nr:LysM peptidoglycan-binding domain-containing protein [Clostridia bacterium]